MPRSKDRHGRGPRGPLVAPDPRTGARSPFATHTKADFFASCVFDAVELVRSHCPEALINVNVAIADVPNLTDHYGTRIPLAASVPGPAGKPSHVIIYRRPLERRAQNRAQLRHLVACRFIEQMSVLTSRSVGDLAGDFELDF